MDADRRPLAESVGPRRDEHQLVVVQGDRLDVGVEQLPGQPEIDLTAQGEIQDLLGMAGPDDQPHVREVPRVANEQCRQDVRAHGRRRAQDQFPGPTTTKLGQQARAGVQRAHRSFGIGEEGASCISQIHPVPAAHEQRRPQLRLEGLDARG